MIVTGFKRDADLDEPMARACEEEARKQAMQDYADYVEGYPDEIRG